MSAVIFDIDHTLAIDNKLERVAFLHLLERIATAGGHALGSLDEEIAAIDLLLAQQRSGACTIDESVERFAFDRGVREFNAYPALYRALALDMVDAFVVPALDARSTLAELAARGCALAILSNGWNPLQARKAQRVGFDGRIFASAELGLRKPDPRAFRAVLNALGVEASGAWYVGDDPHLDVPGALTAGMQVAWLDAQGAAYPTDVPEPSLRIGALADLLQVLR